ncbi:hypothetical protein E2C01_094269 [Portunus trituberculatus]|uniref:SGNH hydrolase-type esterase domain-containing protein n=1 Tax=Portunus trituberculatus TaxID=210409 RepID=A0A5B7JWQ4_PORTR|nr:hypothetical protein [Portunus trituberculatus]
MGDKLSEDLNAALRKIDALTTKLETLGEFVSLNAAPAASPPAPDANDVSVPSQEDFQVVRNNVSPRRRIIPKTKCQNRFQILSDTADDDEEIRIVGDSLTRGQLTEFCARAPTTRRRFCIPGGGVQDVIDSVNGVADQAPATTTYVIHVGTNDVQRVRSEELLDKYRQMIRAFKVKPSKVILSGIISRRQVGNRFYSIATSINRRLANLYCEENIGFVNPWDHFCYDASLFSSDGLHLSQVGAARFGRLMDDAVRDFRAKNGNVLASQARAE